MINPKFAAMTMTRVMQRIRQLDPDVGVQAVETFFTVAATPDIPMADLQESLALASSSISRNVALLGAIHRAGRPGLGLLDAYEDPLNRRMKRVKLTKRGEHLMDSVVSELERLHGKAQK